MNLLLVKDSATTIIVALVPILIIIVILTYGFWFWVNNKSTEHIEAVLELITPPIPYFIPSKLQRKNWLIMDICIANFSCTYLIPT